MRVLIIGAAGRIGSSVLTSCLNRGHTVTAFVRTPSKLPESVQGNPNLRVVKGDAKSKSDLIQAMKDQDAIVQAAVYGSNSPWGTSDSEYVTSQVLEAAKATQSSFLPSSPRLRVWVISGQVLLDVPGYEGKIEGDAVPIHPEHYRNYALFKEQASELDWSFLCPGKVFEGEPVGPIVRTVDHIGLFRPLPILGGIPFIGLLLTILYQFGHQRLSYKGIGEFLADNLGPGGDASQKRVGILEDPYGKTS